MFGTKRIAYLAPLATIALALGCVTSPTDTDVLGLDSGQGGRPTYGTPKEQGLVAVLAKDEEEFLATRPRPRGGAEVKANHSPLPKGQVTIGDIPLVAATPSGPPSISGTPNFHVKVGDTITLSGENFGVNAAVVKVEFKGPAGANGQVELKTATIKSVKNDQIELIVPDGAVDGTIRVTVGDRDPANSTFPLDIVAGNAPTVTQIAPELGKVGDILTITGTNFGTDPNKLIISIGTTKLLASQVTEVSDTQIKVTVPDGFTDGPVIVSKIVDAEKNLQDGGRSQATFKRQS